jgi:amino acid transporter
MSERATFYLQTVPGLYRKRFNEPSILLESRMGEPPKAGQPVEAKLGLWDAVSIIIGIVIGSTIYKTPPIIFSNVSSPWMGLGVWLLGGVLALIGALCYAELTTTYPRAGGDYVYLTRAFGPLVGFLFGWAQLSVVLTGSIGAMAFIFAEYAVELFAVLPENKAEVTVMMAVGAVVVLSIMNILGVVLGKWVQNGLSLIKVIGLGAIILAGFFWSKPGAFSAESWNVVTPVGGPGFGLAMILVLYAYGGWNDAAFVAADVKDRRNLPRALLLGTAGITLIYLAINTAYILSLGWEDAQKFRTAIAADVLKVPLGELGFKVMCLIVMISALGAINGLIFTGSRVYSSLGADHSVFALLGRWNPTMGSPVWALLIQAAISLGMILSVGTKTGRDLIDSVLQRINLSPLPWDQYFGGFDTLFAGTAPVFWTFFLLTGLSLFVLRFKDPNIERPFRLSVPLYPLVPLLFCGMCVFGLYSASTYAKWVSLIGIVPLVVGLPLYLISNRRSPQEAATTDR